MNHSQKSLYQSIRHMIVLIVKYKSILWNDMRIEFSKKYAGSMFGMLWVVLFPTILLGIYIFVYVGVFTMTYTTYENNVPIKSSTMDYVLWVFCGIIPFLGFSEAMTAGCHSIKQNIHLVKNVIFPIELIPVRVVFVSIFTEIISLGILLVLVALFGKLSFHILWFPIILFLQCLFLIGMVWILSVMAVFLQDVTHFVTLATFMLFFMAPICFGLDHEMVQGWKEAVLFLNPLTYIVEMFRHSLFYPGLQTPPTLNPLLCAGYVAMCAGVFAGGAFFFMRFKDLLVDYE